MGATKAASTTTTPTTAAGNSAPMTKQEAMAILSGAQQGDVAAAQAAYYGSGGYYSQSASVITASTQSTSSAPASPAGSGVLMTPQQLANLLGGTVVQLQGQGPWPYTSTQISVGSHLLDANLLAQRYATNPLDVANKMTQDELYMLNNPGMYMSPTGPARLTQSA